MFWDAFYEICKQKGTSPNAVSKAIGMSNAAATGWKNGTQPNAYVLCKIADYLDVSVDYLLGRDRNSAPDDAIRGAVIERVRHMSDDQARRLLAFLESMAEE